MAKDNRRPTKINAAEGPIMDIINSVDPLVYINSREQADRNKNRSGGSSGGGGGGGEETPSHPALTYSVWATWWGLPSNVSSDLVYQHSGIVELLHFGDLETIREVTDTTGLPDNQYQKYLELCSRVPKGRRVLRDYYWQNPSYFKSYDDHYKTTSDATTYTGGVSGYGDPSPVKFLSPWGTQSNADTKTSFGLFLDRCKSDNILFDYLWDDTEGYTTFSLGGTYNTYESTFDANGLPNNYPTWQSIPDPRRTPAIVSDSRFTSVLNQNGRTFSQEVVQKFRDLIGNPSDTRTAAQILSYYTTVTNRQDFNAPWGQSDDIRMAYYAFDAALYTYNFGTLRKNSIIDTLSEKSLSTVKVIQSEVAPLTVAEAKYATDLNTHYVPRDYISGYGSSLHFFGENGVYGSYGYTSNPSTDDERYALVSGGAPFVSPSHMAFIIELRKMRGLMRSRTTAYEQFVPIVTTPSNTFNETKFHYDKRYWYEMMYHLCLHGANYFNVFTEIHTEAEMTAVQTVLDNWKTISGNNTAIPVSNSAGSASTLVDRVNLEEAAEELVISGGYIPSLNKWIWRLTAPPAISNYTLNDPSQTDLPETISIPSGSRGVWIERSVAGRPDYVPSVASYEVPSEANKRMFSEFTLGTTSIGTLNEQFNQMSTEFISCYWGNPFPTGTRAYNWEGDPVNPETSSAWHNILYEISIDAYKWGSRAFSFYGPFGAEEEQPFWKYHQFKHTYTTYTGNKITAPARWKGFKYAIRDLLEGNMKPQGKDPIDEPCNVAFYMTSTRGVPKLWTATNAYWQSLGSTDIERDVNYFKALDEVLDDLIEAKGRTANSGKLYIMVGSAVGNATPSTVSLYRDTYDGYKTDALELGDWYIATKLRNNGIVHFCESRPQIQIDRPQNVYPNPATGDMTDNGWAGKPVVCVQYWLWYSNKENSDPNFENFVGNEDVPLMFILSGSNYPLTNSDPGVPDRDPYDTVTKYTYNGIDRQLNAYNADVGTGQYTPSHWMFEMYQLSDNHRKYNNLPGVVYIYPNILSYRYTRYSSTLYVHPVFDGQGTDPYTNYWRIPCSWVDVRGLFDPAAFLSNPTTYGQATPYVGFWTQNGKNYWDVNVRKNSFSKFIEYVDQYSQQFCPKYYTTDCTNPLYGSVSDELTRNVIELGKFT